MVIEHSTKKQEDIEIDLSMEHIEPMLQESDIASNIGQLFLALLSMFSLIQKILDVGNAFAIFCRGLRRD